MSMKGVKVVEGDFMLLEGTRASGEKLGSVTARADIPFGHKIVRADFAAGENLTKYGQPFGKTKKVIYAGEHVHTSKS